MSGKELKRARLRLKMTQKELGKALGVHKNSVARMERGEFSSNPYNRACREVPSCHGIQKRRKEHMRGIGRTFSTRIHLVDSLLPQRKGVSGKLRFRERGSGTQTTKETPGGDEPGKFIGPDEDRLYFR